MKAWVLMAGFTLSFGSMFSKTWRVHSIFTNVQLNKKVNKLNIQDAQFFETDESENSLLSLLNYYKDMKSEMQFDAWYHPL